MALVPKTAHPFIGRHLARCALPHLGWNGEPSYSTRVAPLRQPADQPVPHHPAAGGEVEQGILALQVGVQAQLLDVLQQSAAGTVDNALGHAGGARRVEDVQRVVERNLSKCDRRLP